MIISRTPVRIPFGGGGTDVISYSSQFGGFILSAAIDKYIYVSVNRRFERSIRVSYSRTEIVDSVSEIQHPLAREALKFTDLKEHLEIVTVADVPAGTGLGTSGSFLVGLLNALHTYKREHIPPQAVAEEACHIEIETLKEPIGKHDQYLAAFGGITSLEIDKNGEVTVVPVKISAHTTAELEHNLLLFYTGRSRSASTVLKEQSESTTKNEEKIINSLHRIKEIGREIKKALEEGRPDYFGQLLNEHWRVKKELSSKVSDPQIDRWYEIALKNGASGGKIMGAGGGGFFMFYCRHDKDKLREAMTKEELEEVRFRFDFEGSKILVNL